MKTTHIALTLRGDCVREGIHVSGGQVPFSPHSGMTRHNTGLLASTPAPDGSLDKIHVAVTEHGVVLVPCEETPQKELVLVQQYSPGSGGKRWPSFHVEFGPEVRQLSSASTSGGSGGETWVLVSAPLGWAQNIAAQFVKERDYGGQTISYKSDFNPREQELERQLAEAREQLECFDRELEAAKRGENDYVVLSFAQGKHPKTGEVQWENTARQNGKTVKLVVNAYGQRPSFPNEQWVCRKRRVLVDNPSFQLILVDLAFRPVERDVILAEIQKIEAELAQIRKSAPAENSPSVGNGAMAEAIRKADLLR